MSIMQVPQDVPVFDTYDEFMDWCWKVRIGEIKVSNEARQYAKVMTYHRAYGIVGLKL